MFHIRNFRTFLYSLHVNSSFPMAGQTLAHIILYVVTSAVLTCGVTVAQPGGSLVRYVNPFIGTGAHGHTYPGASVPFGMVQLSPDAGKSGWDWCSGYHYSDTSLAGFSHTHLSGTGCGDLGDILFTPGTSIAVLDDRYRAPFRHAEESASAGYYSVRLQDSGIKVELTATCRAGFHRYTFPRTDSAFMVINLGYGQDDITTETECAVLNDSTVAGSRFSNGWAANQRVYFAARFSQPVRSITWYKNGIPLPLGESVRGKKIKALLRFTVVERTPLLAKVGISAVSTAGALKNLHREIPGWDFALVRQSAEEAWERELGKIAVEGADEERKTVFYTALYHTMLAPTVYSDVDSLYRGADDSIHAAGHFVNYSIFSLWDTFRAAHPLYTIMHPDRVNDMVNAMLAFAREYGYLPVWPLAANETNTMIGYHAVPVIVDAYLKGNRGFDVMEAYRAMKKSALRDHRGLKYLTPSVADLNAGTGGEEGPGPASTPRLMLNGYAATIAGDTIGYHSAHPEVTQALVLRASGGRGTMTWKTAMVPKKVDEDKVAFTWLAGVAAGKGGHRFDLALNRAVIFSFHSAATSHLKGWNAEGPNGASLSFRASSTDAFGDLYGTMVLTVRKDAVVADAQQEIQVTGEPGGGPDWYMTFMHPFTPRMTLTNDYGILNEGGKQWQIVRADIESLGPPRSATITAGGNAALTTWIYPGLTTVRLRIPAVMAAKHVTVTLSSAKRVEFEGSVAVAPVSSIGYVPADQEQESVSKTLEYAYDDWCIAQVAKALGFNDDYALFMDRAGNYRNLYDHTTGFMRGRDLSGAWRSPFNPRFSTLKQPEYTEGNAWQYTWFVPHDVLGLIDLMGGKVKFTRRLDSLFEQASDLEGTGAPADVSGLIGLYAHGNEPSHHIAYLYACAGKPWKTQALVRRILKTMYGAAPDGLCGNEDCGQMSSWFVWSALGLYPVNPADGTYVIGSPALEQAIIAVGGGRTFRMTARNLSDENVYVQSVRLNGVPLDRLYVRHADIMNGGSLEFVMGKEPDTRWGTGRNVAPPSMSK